MMLIILLGIVTSMAAEVVTAINKKLSGTVLKGDGAFLVAFAMAFIGAFIKEITMPGFTFATLGNWTTLTQTFGEVFTVSQLFFMVIVKKLELDVQPAPAVKTTNEGAATLG